MKDYQTDKVNEIKAIAQLLEVTEKTATISSDILSHIGNVINDLCEQIKQD